MKNKLTYCFYTAIACSLLISSAAANQITLLNASPNNQALVLNYKIARKNTNSPTALGPLQTIKLRNKATISFPLNGYQLAGIVAISINNHMLPKTANTFNRPRQCALTTNNKYRDGILTFILTYSKPPHGKISCLVNGGVKFPD